MSEQVANQAVQIKQLDTGLGLLPLPDRMTVVAPDAANFVQPSTVIAVTGHVFHFRENVGSPGRYIESSFPITPPAGTTHYFTVISALRNAFTTADYTRLDGWPLGQFYIESYLDARGLVCGVQLTGGNHDHPISISARITVVFLKTP